ncbi:MAG: hypothetical protein HDKAJFGB_02672 [Anaerolineae bacterium]|nr:hypothetical protein [Anaerolineae bacterium]
MDARTRFRWRKRITVRRAPFADAVIRHKRVGLQIGKHAFLDSFGRAIFIRQQIVCDVNFYFCPHVIKLGRRLIVQKNFIVPMVGGTIFRRRETGFIAHLGLHQARWNRQRVRGDIFKSVGFLIDAFQNIVPQRRRARDARNVLHRLIARIADPHAQYKFIRAAERPIVFVIVGRAGFDKRRARGFERRIGAKSRRARGIVRKDIGNEIRIARVQHLFGLRIVARRVIKRTPCAVHNFQKWRERRALALVGKHGIRVREFGEFDFAAAQRQREAIMLRIVKGRDAQTLRHAHHFRHADKI